MSVTVRPYVNGGWEVDIRVELPVGTIVRERKKASASGKAAAQRWAEALERVLLVNGKPKQATIEDVLEPTTLKELRHDSWILRERQSFETERIAGKIGPQDALDSASWRQATGHHLH